MYEQIRILDQTIRDLWVSYQTCRTRLHLRFQAVSEEAEKQLSARRQGRAGSRDEISLRRGGHEGDEEAGSVSASARCIGVYLWGGLFQSKDLDVSGSTILGWFQALLSSSGFFTSYRRLTQ